MRWARSVHTEGTHGRRPAGVSPSAGGRPVLTAKRRFGDPSHRGMPSELDEGTADANVVAEQLGELARSLQSSPDTEDLLNEVVVAAVRLIPGVDEASISVVRNRREVSSRLPTGE